ncbi:MAG TPA: ATPase [Porticoccaceae bacterium]|nr:ATPase [Porticoccaceae bacterium]
MSDCCKPGPVVTTTPACCASQPPTPVQKSRPDYLLWGSASIVAVGYLIHLLVGGQSALPEWLTVMSSGAYELINKMWWGLLMAVAFVGLLERIPRELVMSALGQGGTPRGVIRATFAGVLLDLCSHGILMVGTKLYERGASLGQLMAFLIASPWNSLSLTVVLITFRSWGYTLAFVALSMLIGIVTGLIFDRLVARNILPANPNSANPNSANPSSAANDDSLQEQANKPVWPQIVSALKQASFTPKGLVALLWDGLRDSRMVFRWLLFGIVLATAIRAFVPMDTYQTLFGPTVAGLFLTLLAATIIEVCSEGSTPIAADILTRAGAPGNGFTFLMAGVATDYTEVMVIKDTTKSWKIALFLPLITLPQVLVIGWLLNQG